MNITVRDFNNLVSDTQRLIARGLERAWETGTLEEKLAHLGLQTLIQEYASPTRSHSRPDGKIVIIGESKVSADQIIGMAKKLGIDRGRLSLHLGYASLAKIDLRRFQYQAEYRLILIGPSPHSVRGRSHNSSAISMLEKEIGYPKVIRLEDAHSLKITRNSLLKALSAEINSGYIVV